MATWPGRKQRDKDNPYIIYRADGWTWKVLKMWSSPEKQMEDPDNERWLVAVQSPWAPGGDMGDTYISDIFSSAPELVHIDDEFEDALEDQGYDEYLKWLRIASLSELGEDIYPSGVEDEWVEEMGYPLTDYEKSMLSEIAPDDPRFRMNPSDSLDYREWNIGLNDPDIISKNIRRLYPSGEYYAELVTIHGTMRSQTTHNREEARQDANDMKSLYEREGIRALKSDRYKSFIMPKHLRGRKNPPLSEEERAAINRVAKKLGDDPDLQEWVQSIESSVETTRGHYGKYMNMITELAGDKGELFAMAIAGGLKNAGANPEGVNSALRVMYGGR